MTVEEEELDTTKLTLRSANCKTNTAIAVCMIEPQEEEGDVTKEESTEGTPTNDESTASSNIPGVNLPGFPCISQSKRKKRASAAVGDSNEVQTNVEKEYELKGIMILTLEVQNRLI